MMANTSQTFDQLQQLIYKAELGRERQSKVNRILADLQQKQDIEITNSSSGASVLKGVLDRKVDLIDNGDVDSSTLDNLPEDSLFWDRYANFYDSINPLPINGLSNFEKPRFIYIKKSGSWVVFSLQSRINVKFLGLEPVPGDIEQYYGDDLELNKQINYLYKNPDALNNSNWDTSGIDENLMQDIFDLAYESGVKNVFFPAGYYIVTRSKFVYDEMVIEGAGAHSTEFRTPWLDDDTIVLNSDTNAKTDRFYLGDGNYHLTGSVGSTDGETYYQGLNGNERKSGDEAIFKASYRPLVRRKDIVNGDPITETTVDSCVFRDFGAKTNSINRSDDGVFKFDGLGGPCRDNTFRNLFLHDIGGDAMYIYRCVTSTLDRITVERCANKGMNLNIATSTSVISCYMNSCLITGYAFHNGNYMSMIGCAADSCGKAYDLSKMDSITLSGCGAESVRLIANESLIVNKTSGDLNQPNSEYASVPGIALDIDNSQGVVVNGFYLFRTSRGVFDNSGNISTDFPYTRFCRVNGSQNIELNNPVIKSVNRYRYDDDESKWELENDMLDSIYELRNSPEFRVNKPSYDSWDRTPNVYLDTNGDLRRYMDDQVLLNEYGDVQGVRAGDIIPIDSDGGFIDGDESIWVNHEYPYPKNTNFNQSLTNIFNYSSWWAFERAEPTQYSADVAGSRYPNTRKYLSENNSWRPVKFSPYWTGFGGTDVWSITYPYFNEQDKSFNIVDIENVKSLGIPTESNYVDLVQGFDAYNYEVVPDSSVTIPADQIALVEDGYNVLYLTEKHLNKIVTYDGKEDLYVRLRKNPYKVSASGDTVQSQDRDVFGDDNSVVIVQGGAGRVFIDHNTVADKDDNLVTSSYNPYEEVSSLAPNMLYTALVNDSISLYHKGGGFWIGETTTQTELQYVNDSAVLFSNLNHGYKTDLKIGANSPEAYLLENKARGVNEEKLPFAQRIVNQTGDFIHIGHDADKSDVPEIYSDNLIHNKSVSANGTTTVVRGVSLLPYGTAYVKKTFHNTNSSPDSYYISGDIANTIVEDYFANELLPHHANKIVRTSGSIDIECSAIANEASGNNFTSTIILTGSGRKRIDVTGHNSVVAPNSINDFNGIDVFTENKDPAVVFVFMKFDPGSGSYDVYIYGDVMETFESVSQVVDGAAVTVGSEGNQNVSSDIDERNYKGFHTLKMGVDYEVNMYADELLPFFEFYLITEEYGSLSNTIYINANSTRGSSNDVDLFDNNNATLSNPLQLQTSGLYRVVFIPGSYFPNKAARFIVTKE